jgi:hypothetical protein
LEEADVIVWFPDDFDPPTVDQRRFLEQWLWNENGRTLVYVGRDFDATPVYWKRVGPSAPPQQAMDVARRLAQAQAEHTASRVGMPDDESADWFVTDRDRPRRRIDRLQGSWSAGVDAAQAELEVTGRFQFPDASQVETWIQRDDQQWDTPEFHTLLSSDDDLLATSLSSPDWGDSKVLVVTNGSFLLNLPLVNPEHRKLAARLISECQPARRVVFLESGPGGPPVLSAEPSAAYPTGLEMFTVWPLGIVLLHLAALGIALGFASFPIFGRPGQLPVASVSDFGQHVAAVGQLLERANQPDAALARLKYYHDHVRRESGASHRGERSAVPRALRPKKGS